VGGPTGRVRRGARDNFILDLACASG